MTPGRRLTVLLATVLLGAGCLVEVEKTSDPGPAFAEARREAARLQGLTGPPETLEVLVYDRADGELVRVSVPLSVVETMGDEDVDLDLGEDAEDLRRRIRGSDLRDAPLGPLVEVDEEDGDQVLVWLR